MLAVVAKRYDCDCDCHLLLLLKRVVKHSGVHHEPNPQEEILSDADWGTRYLQQCNCWA
jgi:hypothetical protein